MSIFGTALEEARVLLRLHGFIEAGGGDDHEMFSNCREPGAIVLLYVDATWEVYDRSSGEEPRTSGRDAATLNKVLTNLPKMPL